MRDIDYGKPNSILQLNTLAFVLILYFIEVILLILLKLYLVLTKGKLGGESIYKSLKNQLIFSELINLYIGAFFEFAISAMQTFQFANYSTLGEVISSLLSYFSFTVIGLFIVPAAIWMLFLDTKKLKNDDFRDIWGQFYQDLKFEDRWSRCFILVFVIRRMIYILVSFYIETFTNQVLTLFVSNFVVLMYQGANYPANRLKENRLIILNEWLIIMTCSTILLFTPLFKDPFLQYDLGWITVGLTLLVTVINLINLLYQSFRYIILIIRLYYYKLVRYELRQKMRKQMRQRAVQIYLQKERQKLEHQRQIKRNREFKELLQQIGMGKQQTRGEARRQQKMDKLKVIKTLSQNDCVEADQFEIKKSNNYSNHQDNSQALNMGMTSNTIVEEVDFMFSNEKQDVTSFQSGQTQYSKNDDQLYKAQYEIKEESQSQDQKIGDINLVPVQTRMMNFSQRNNIQNQLSVVEESPESQSSNFSIQEYQYDINDYNNRQ